MLPGGEWVLFTLRPSGANDWDDAQIVAQSLEAGDRRVLISGGRDARYVRTGHLVYVPEGTLFALPFDAQERIVTSPVPLVEGILGRGNLTGAASFSLSNTGALVYVPRAAVAGESVLGRVDRTGQMTPLMQGAEVYLNPRLSPDGGEVALTIRGDTFDIGLYDIERDRTASE